MRVCSQCRKIFKTTKSSHSPFCNYECEKEWHQIHKKHEYKCDYCGIEILTTNRKLDKNIRGIFCSDVCSQKSQIIGKHLTCDFCGKVIYRRPSCEHANNFCSLKCQHDFTKREVEKVCHHCGKKYFVKKSQEFNSRFCSMKCKNEWQTTEENYGKSNPCYKSIEANCALCGALIGIAPHKIGKSNRNFCSTTCARGYYSIIENRTEKQRKIDKSIGLNAIRHVKPTLTKPHMTIIRILNDNRIYFRIEELIKYYKLDVYLPNQNLGIEINGDYWHCNPLRFSEIKYKSQFERISSDKSKNTYVKKKYGYNILYIWERDITRNLELCELLILKYIADGGVLENYNSFNYHVEDNKIVINDTIIKPFQEMPLSEYKHLLVFNNAS